PRSERPSAPVAHARRWLGGVLRREQAPYDVGRAALVRGRTAGADAGISGDGGIHGEQLLTAGAGLLGAYGRDLGRGKSYLRAAGDTGRREEPAGGISHRRRRHQSVP